MARASSKNAGAGPLRRNLARALFEGTRARPSRRKRAGASRGKREALFNRAALCAAAVREVVLLFRGRCPGRKVSRADCAVRGMPQCGCALEASFWSAASRGSGATRRAGAAVVDGMRPTGRDGASTRLIGRSLSKGYARLESLKSGPDAAGAMRGAPSRDKNCDLQARRKSWSRKESAQLPGEELRVELSQAFARDGNTESPAGPPAPIAGPLDDEYGSLGGEAGTVTRRGYAQARPKHQGAQPGWPSASSCILQAGGSGEKGFSFEKILSL